MNRITYRELAAKVRASTTDAQVARAEQAAERIYNAGLLTVREYARLCDLALVKLGALSS